MGAVANGLALHGLRPFCATFLVFSDYMKPAVRLAALMKLPVIYVFTHDSIFVGEDGPTHQPIEHLAALRVIPDMRVLRPADAEETALAWELALKRVDGPTALALTRQNLEVFAKPADWRRQAARGAYAAKDCAGAPEVVIVATGSEVGLAIKAAEASGRQVRVVSMISRELFQAQDERWRGALVPKGVRAIVAEYGCSSGWEGFVQRREDLFTIDGFGASAPGQKVAEFLKRSQADLTALIKS
jgi:transketolase